jgi:N-acetylmuramic acid 6-phosphate etherase
MHLDRMPVRDAVRLMLREEAKVPRILERESARLSRAVRLIASQLRRGGRLFYVGAGTSGRLGILDASECPPTFRTPPDQVQGIIAGGPRAITQAVEGAEDDEAAGRQSVRERNVGPRDVVVGIAASGNTPFVWGALVEAKNRGTQTVLVCFNPQVRIRAGAKPDVVIRPSLGPEVLTGSTRLKAGTATKLVLNIFSTLSMVQLGKVASNLMVDLNPSNVKLRSRAVRITQALTGCTDAEAHRALESAGWVVKAAVARLTRRTSSRPVSYSRAGTTRAGTGQGRTSPPGSARSRQTSRKR